MKRKKSYLILGKKNRRLFGVFVRNKDGHDAAKKYKEKLSKLHKMDFVIK
jgi:hypothetical protein